MSVQLVLGMVRGDLQGRHEVPMCRQACGLNWIYGWSATTSRYANSATCSSALLHGCLKTDRGYVNGPFHSTDR